MKHFVRDKKAREVRILFIASVFIMALGVVFAYFFAGAFQSILSASMKDMLNLVHQGKHAHSWMFTFWMIFAHNSMSVLAMIVLGFVFGIMPAWNLWVNGLLMGYLMALLAGKGIPAWKTFVFGILPHGIFELTAIFWAAGLGLANGFATLRWLGNQFVVVTKGVQLRNRTSPIKEAMLRSVQSLPYILGLLFIAAFIESTVTPHLIEWAFGHSVS